MDSMLSQPHTRNDMHSGRNACRQTAAPLLLVVLVLFLSLAGMFPSATAVAAENKSLQEEIDQYREQIRRLQRGILAQQQKTAETRKDENNLLGELEEIDKRLKSQRKKVEDLDVKVGLQQMLIDLKKEEIATLQSERQKVLSHLEKRSNAYYKMGKIGFLNVTFSSHSLPDLLRFHESFHTLVTYDKNLIIDYRHRIQDLQRARDAQTLELKLLQEFKEEAQTEREKIDRIRSEKEQLLARIRTQKHLHEQAAMEMETATDDLGKTLQTLKSKEKNLEKVFANSKGRLRVPVPGRVITYFNQEKFNRLGILRKSSGIAIAAEEGAKVQAVADGTVVFSGYLRGYGNTVIIHHGYQYYTITSRLENISPREGEMIKAGSGLGQVSETAALIDEGVYFEIRHGKESQDPLQWLDVGKLEHSSQLQKLNQG